MIRKFLAFLLVGFVAVIAGDAQTPAPGAKAETHAFSMFFDGDGAYLGIQTVEVTKDNFSKYGLREVRGVAVEKVVEGSPAEKAGLQAGDVIVRFNSDEVTSARKLTRLIGEVSPDHQVRLTVIRGGGEREIVATAGKRPMPKFEEGGFTWTRPNAPDFPQGEFQRIPRMERRPGMETLPPGVPGEPFVYTFGSGRRIGVTVTGLTKQLGDHFGVASGVMISEVRVDSPAAKAGLKAGDIIVEAEGKEVKGEGDLMRVIQEKKEGDVTLTIVRDRNRQTIRVTPEEVKNEFHRGFDFPMTQPNGFLSPSPFQMVAPAIPSVINAFRFPGCIF